MKLKILVILTTVFFICLSAYFTTLRSVLEKKEKIYLNFQFLKKQLTYQRALISKYSNYQEINKKLNQFYFCLQPNNFWRNSFSNKINFLSIRIENFPNILQIEINLSGTNKNIFKFVNEIIALNKFVTIKNFKCIFFNSITENINQNILILFKFYIFNFNNKELILDWIKKYKFTAQSFIINHNLTKFSLDKIEMVGFLSDDKKQSWGFVRLPNKKICKVELGDYLGLEQGLVIGVYSTKIIIKNNNNLKKIIILLNTSKKNFYA